MSEDGIGVLTKCAALDLAPCGIRVSPVGSGVVGTPAGLREMARRAYENDRTPVGHIEDPEDVAGAVRFLDSERADSIVGEILPADGGKEVTW